MAPSRKTLLLGGAGIAALVLAIVRRKDIATSASYVVSKAVDFSKSAAFAAALPSRGRYLADVFLRVGQEVGVSPFLLAALAEQESQYGTQLRADGTGDFIPRSWTATPLPPDGMGWGRGIMQIDYGSERGWLSMNNWRDPYTNIKKAAQIFKAKLDYLKATPKTPTVAVTGDEATRRGVASGVYRDPRPLSGDLLFRAALAAYNTGELNALRSVAVGVAPDKTTYGGNYGSTLLPRIAALTAAFDKLAT